MQPSDATSRSVFHSAASGPTGRLSPYFSKSDCSTYSGPPLGPTRSRWARMNAANARIAPTFVTPGRYEYTPGRP
ncbi:hypothetical protein [Mycolicibacterium monacense]|uniref:hypothetical protein n=1 Tax=Mycolicibacterium monacense TaxID=85693 RepID=UPI001BCB3CF6|nr:hypothetical protein [Mycolicibacterium monacense]